MAGALVGAVLGVMAMALLGLLTYGFSDMLNASVLFPAAAIFGSLAGASLAPLSAWLLLRRVSLGRAIGHTAAGTAIGVLIGFGMGRVFNWGILNPAILGIVGFVAAAARLRLTTPHVATGQIAHARQD
jgi:hypothetical protein